MLSLDNETIHLLESIATANNFTKSIVVSLLTKSFLHSQENKNIIELLNNKDARNNAMNLLQ